MNWLTMIFRALQLAPMVVAGIEHIHGEASGATKKQMAMDALALASGTAGAALPEQSAAIDAATQLTSNVIDGVVSVYNAVGWNAKGAAAAGVAVGAAPAPVAAPAPAAAAAPAPVAAPAPDAGTTQRTGD